MTQALLGDMAKRKRIDYSKFALAKTVPIRSPKHLAYVRTFPCSECGDTDDIQAHHLTIIKGGGGMSRKTDDNWVVPMCGVCHHYLHWMGEQPYWTERKLDPKIYAALLWDSFNKKELNNG
jgi:hypothetical protein